MSDLSADVLRQGADRPPVESSDDLEDGRGSGDDLSGREEPVVNLHAVGPYLALLRRDRENGKERAREVERTGGLDGFHHGGGGSLRIPEPELGALDEFDSEVESKDNTAPSTPTLNAPHRESQVGERSGTRMSEEGGAVNIEVDDDEDAARSVCATPFDPASVSLYSVSPVRGLRGLPEGSGAVDVEVEDDADAVCSMSVTPFHPDSLVPDVPADDMDQDEPGSVHSAQSMPIDVVSVPPDDESRVGDFGGTRMGEGRDVAAVEMEKYEGAVDYGGDAMEVDADYAGGESEGEPQEVLEARRILAEAEEERMLPWSVNRVSIHSPLTSSFEETRARIVVDRWERDEDEREWIRAAVARTPLQVGGLDDLSVGARLKLVSFIVLFSPARFDCPDIHSVSSPLDYASSRGNLSLHQSVEGCPRCPIRLTRG